MTFSRPKKYLSLLLMCLLAGTAGAQQFLVVLASDIRIYDAKEMEKLVYHSADEQPLLIRVEMKEFSSSGECRIYRITTESKDVTLFTEPDNPDENRRFLFKENVIGVNKKDGQTKSFLVSEDFKSVNFNKKTGKLKDGTVVELETDITECSDSCINRSELTMMQYWEIKETNEMYGVKKGEYESLAFSLGTIKPGILFLYEIAEDKLKKFWKPTPYTCLYRKK